MASDMARHLGVQLRCGSLAKDWRRRQHHTAPTFGDFRVSPLLSKQRRLARTVAEAAVAAFRQETNAGQESMLDRFYVSAFVVALVGIGFAASPHAAQEYPARPVTVIVPSTAGGGTDIVSRIVGEQLAEQLGQPFVIDDRPGAGSVVGTVAAANATPDGYTLLTGLIANMAVNPSLFAKLPYDPIRDFAPVSMLAKYPFVVVVSNNLPVHSIKELIALAKSRPGEINYASAGNGTGQHLSAELFKLVTGINLTHVPYRGAQPAYADVISGQVPVFFDNLASALGQIKGGNVRALAVTGAKRSPLLPDVPTVAEAGVPDYQYYVWFGLWAPKKTPQPLIDKLHAEVEKALANPTVKERIAAGAGEPFQMPLAEIETFVKSEIAKWADVVKRGGVTVQ
jgi:tripartite-type tricarboxylate transporter receptor subunit TctC